MLFGFLMLFTVGGGLVLVWQGAQNMRAASMLAHPAKLVAVPVTIAAAAKAGRRTNYTFRNPTGRRPQAKFVGSFRAGEEPLMISNGRGEVFGVAVTHPATPVPVLLDSGMKRLDLSPEERAAAVASIRGGQF